MSRSRWNHIAWSREAADIPGVIQDRPSTRIAGSNMIWSIT